MLRDKMQLADISSRSAPCVTGERARMTARKTPNAMGK
jgi:hypothetical protein